MALSRLRGEPGPVLATLKDWLGHHPLLSELASTLELVVPAAARHGVALQLDPSFQPHFALYDGLVLKLVCQGSDAPVEIASGGRYDALVGRFQAAGTPQGEAQPEPQAVLASGVGFGFDIEAVRELPELTVGEPASHAPHLVAFRDASGLGAALEALEQLHQQGQRAELHGQPLADRQSAEAVAANRGCSGVTFVA
jgi:ATP phosphoribosyltransferase regulatory subunit